MKESIKTLVGQSIFASGLHTALLKNAAVVVAFHRVRDTDQPEDLSVSVRTVLPIFQPALQGRAASRSGRQARAGRQAPS
jgi:hypothetical protein